MALVIGPNSGPVYPPLVDLAAPPPVFPDFTPLFPPPLLGSVPSFSVPPAVGPDSGPVYPPLNDTGLNAIVWPDFSTTFPTPAVTFANTFMNWGPPPMVASTRNAILNGWGPPGPQATPPPGGITPPGGFG